MKNIKNKILQIINNKNFKRIAIVVILFALIFGFYKSLSNSNKDLILVNNRIDRRQFQIYKQKESGEGYEVYNGSGFPSGLILNTTLTTCVDNNKNPLSDVYTYENGKFSLTSNKTVFCTLYFDLTEPLNKMLRNSALAVRYTGTGSSSSGSPFFENEIYQVPNTVEGQASNNVLFGGFCWKILRTTDNGGIKLLYNGYPTISYDDGSVNYTCNGDGEGLTMKNDDSERVYIYGTYAYYYGTDYTYDESTKKFSLAGDLEAVQLNTQSAANFTLKDKYTCKSTSSTGTCDSILKVTGYDKTNYVKGMYYRYTKTNNIGTSVYNRNGYSSPGYVSYMYNKIYSVGSTYNQMIVPASVTGIVYGNLNNNTYTNWYYSNTIRETNCRDDNSLCGEGGEGCTVYVCDYELVDPVLGSDLYNNGVNSLTGYFTLMSDDITNIASTTVYLMHDGGNNDRGYYVFDSFENAYNGYFTVLIQSQEYNESTGEYETYYSYDDQYFTSMTSDVTNYIDISYANSVYYDSNTSKYSLNNPETTSFHGQLSPSGIVSGDGEDINGKYLCIPSQDCGGEGGCEEINSYNQTTNCNKVGYILGLYIEESDSGGLSSVMRVSLYIYYLILDDGETTVAGALNKMFRDSNVNTTSSTAKEFIDMWYEENLIDYDSYLDKEEIFCNSRAIKTTNNYSQNWNPSTAVACVQNNYAPIDCDIDISLAFEDDSLACTNKLDAFSVTETTKGNGSLTYPIGLPTKYEIANGDNTYLVNNSTVTSTPLWYRTTSFYAPNGYDFISIGSYYYIHADGYGKHVSYSTPFRPAIALKKGKDRYIGGTGQANDPYIVSSGLYDVSIDSEIFNKFNKGIPGRRYELLNDIYDVTSFKLNGTTINGNSFVMPKGNASITDIVYSQGRYYVNNSDNNINIKRAYTPGDTVKLITNDYKEVLSFKMNETLVNGNSFTMPSEDVTITEVTYSSYYFVETETHNPFPATTGSTTYYENTFEGATSITVELTYQTYNTSSTYSYVKLYKAASTVHGTYYHGVKQTTTVTIPTNYLKIEWYNRNSGSSYINKYGFSAKITPNYP